MEKPREPRRALHQGADRRPSQADDEVPFPRPRHRPYSHIRPALSEPDHQRDDGLAPPGGPDPRDAQSPPAPQAGGQVTAQGSPALNEQRLVESLMAEAHRLVLRIVEPQAPSDLLRTPRRGPSSVLPAPVTAALPRH